MTDAAAIRVCDSDGVATLVVEAISSPKIAVRVDGHGSGHLLCSFDAQRYALVAPLRVVRRDSCRNEPSGCSLRRAAPARPE